MPKKRMNNIHGWPFCCRAVLLFPVSWDNRYCCHEIDMIMVQFLLASTSSSSLTQTMQAREASPGNVHGCLGLTCTFLHCHYTRMLQRQCGQATVPLSKSTLTAVIVQVTEQYNDPCLNSSLPQYGSTTSSTTVLFCEHNNTLLSRARSSNW